MYAQHIMVASEVCKRRSRMRGAASLFLGLLLAVSVAVPAAGQGRASAATESAAPLSAAPFSAAGIGTGTRTIGGLWQFHTGDDPAWAKPDFDDHAWEQLPADKPWGDAGHPRYWGYAWYRRQIALDPKSKQPLAVLLPPLDSIAEVYWNGVKIGSEGTMPPHPNWFRIQQPVAIPLPPMNGASSGVLALRIWAVFRSDREAPDLGGFQGPLLLGYRPLIQKMPDAWAEHLWRTRAFSNLSTFLCLITSIAGLALWLRSRTKWVLLFVALFFGANAVSLLYIYTLTASSINVAEPIGAVASVLTRLSCFGLILFVADLPRRTGVKGFRFWAGLCLGAACLGLFQLLLSQWYGVITSLHYFVPSEALSPFITTLGRAATFLDRLYVRALPLFALTLLGACLILSRRTLPRVLFMVAAALDQILQFVTAITNDATSHLAWLHPFLMRPLLQIYGSTLTKATTTRMLVLTAVVYAVWDQLSQQVARQRFVNAEMKAAQEIQQVLVPPTAERDAPGFAVSSVYRPASEVGGDFFQIISLEGNGTGDGTLIVAGDVSGKGLRAAMTVSLMVGALRTLAEYDPEPAAVLAGLNRRLTGRIQGGFVTCCAVRIDPKGRATMANAGHCQPYVDGREIDLPKGLPLGIIEDVAYEEVAVELRHGQQLTMMSDGVVEARNHHGELYGFERLNRLMRQRPSAEHVADTAVTFGQDDDITVVTVTRLAHA